MIELIVAHPHAFWLSLGGLLLAAEMLGGNGYLLWSGVAAVITGLVVWLLPVGWEWQGALFAVLTLLAAWLWWRWLNKRVKAQKPVDAHLNQRGQQIVGRRFTLCIRSMWFRRLQPLPEKWAIKTEKPPSLASQISALLSFLPRSLRV